MAIVQDGQQWQYARCSYLTTVEIRAHAAAHADKRVGWDELAVDDQDEQADAAGIRGHRSSAGPPSAPAAVIPPGPSTLFRPHSSRPPRPPARPPSRSLPTRSRRAERWAPDPQVVTTAALAGPWRLDALTARLAVCAGWGGPDEVGDVVALLLGRWRRRPRSSPRRIGSEVAALLAARARRRHVIPEEPPEAATVGWRWPVEPWTGLDAPARGLDLRGGELDWFADRGGWPRRTPEGPLHHYRSRWTASRSGVPRLLEAPGPRLMELQRRFGRRVLARIPVHDAAHGYVRGARRSPSPRSTRAG